MNVLRIWRSGLFWRFFTNWGLLIPAAFLALGILLASSNPYAADGVLQRQLWLTIVAAAVATLVLSFVLTSRLVRPLLDIAQGARQLAEGTYGRRVFPDHSEALGELAESFNRTSEHLAVQMRQLTADREQLRAVLESMVEGVIVVDRGQRILFANHRAGQMMEFDAENAIGKRLWEVVRNRQVHELVAEAMASPGRLMRDVTLHSADVRHLTVSVSSLTERRGIVLVCHDTTELRKLEQVRRDFVANVSHELKTPLAVIQTNVETLLDGAIDDLDHRERFLQSIADEAARLHRLILDLLSLARIESGYETFDFQPVAIAEIVDACRRQRQSFAADKGQRLITEAPGAAISAWADAEALLEILDNLVDNAIKYTPAGGTIRVRWWQERGEVHIAVEDTGVGIPPHELPRVFQRFYRVDKARSRQLGGTGLGLSIVKHLTLAMNGNVRAESKMNEGSRFVVTLPAYRPTQSIDGRGRRDDR